MKTQHPGIVIVNAGSSSIKLSFFELDAQGPAIYAHGHMEGIGTHRPHMALVDATGETLEAHTFAAGDVADHTAAYRLLREAIERDLSGFQPFAIGHRIVHGGVHFDAPVVIDAAVKREIEALGVLAPLHQPPALAAIEMIESIAPDILQVAGFDTAFHFHRDRLHQLTGLPYDYFEQGLRRYGFHGLSYEYIAQRLKAEAPDLYRGSTIVAHLGGGSSLCAMQKGRSIDTTMSLTPLDGLPMGTRCGSLDPGALLYLLGQGMSVDRLRHLIYYDSGLKGLSGISSDMRELLASREPRAAMAVEYFVERLAQECARMAQVMQGFDGLVFTGGIGEHAAPIRERLCARLQPLFGVDCDREANRGSPVGVISSAESRVEVRVMPTDEEGMLARHVWRLWRQRNGE
jgi:acetate kinase